MAPRAALLLGLIGLAGCGKTEPTPLDDNTVHYDAIGASDTIGVGSSAPCMPLIACTSGPGYVQQVTRRLESDGKSVTLVNLGVPGAVLSPDIQAIGASVGMDAPRNVLLDEAPYVRRTATLATVFIGANDANIVGRAVRNGHGGGNPSGYIQTQIQNFARDMQTLVATVRGRSSKIRVVALNLPNVANTPYAAGLSLDEKRMLQEIAVGFSAGINALAGQGVVVVDLMCDPNFYNPAIFSSDGFHPNDAGYGYMAELVYAAATSSRPGPQSSCSFMTVF